MDARTGEQITTPPQNTTVYKRKYKMHWKMLLRVRTDCINDPTALMQMYSSNLYVISYDGCSYKKRYYQSLMYVGYDAPAAEGKLALLCVLCVPTDEGVFCNNFVCAMCVYVSYVCALDIIFFIAFDYFFRFYIFCCVLIFFFFVHQSKSRILLDWE